MGRKAFVREKVIEAAFDLFAKRGYEAVSTRDIAAQANIGHASMYRHFQSKEDVGREVYKLGLAPIMDGFSEIARKKLSKKKMLREVVRRMCNWYDTRPRALALLIFPPHDFCPEELDEVNPRNPRCIIKNSLQCDEDTLAVVWGAVTGPLQDRYLRRRQGLMEPVADELALIVVRLITNK